MEITIAFTSGGDWRLVIALAFRLDPAAAGRRNDLEPERTGARSRLDVGNIYRAGPGQTFFTPHPAPDADIGRCAGRWFSVTFTQNPWSNRKSCGCIGGFRFVAARLDQRIVVLLRQILP